MGFARISRGNSNDLPPMPIPAAIWLFGTSLLGVIGIAKRRYD